MSRPTKSSSFLCKAQGIARQMQQLDGLEQAMARSNLEREILPILDQDLRKLKRLTPRLLAYRGPEHSLYGFKVSEAIKRDAVNDLLEVAERFSSFVNSFGNRGLELETLTTLAYRIVKDSDKVNHVPQTIIADTAVRDAAKKLISIAHTHHVFVPQEQSPLTASTTPAAAAELVQYYSAKVLQFDVTILKWAQNQRVIEARHRDLQNIKSKPKTLTLWKSGNKWNPDTVATIAEVRYMLRHIREELSALQMAFTHESGDCCGLAVIVHDMVTKIGCWPQAMPGHLLAPSAALRDEMLDQRLQRECADIAHLTHTDQNFRASLIGQYWLLYEEREYFGKAMAEMQCSICQTCQNKAADILESVFHEICRAEWTSGFGADLAHALDLDTGVRRI